jgi:hypothetical protein
MKPNMPDAEAIEARAAIEWARGLAFNSLMEDADGSEDKANEWFTRMVIEAFAQHFLLRTPGELDDVATAVLANMALEEAGAGYRLMRVP